MSSHFFSLSYWLSSFILSGGRFMEFCGVIVSGLGSAPETRPGAVAPAAHPAPGVLAQWWEDGDIGGRMGTPPFPGCLHPTSHGPISNVPTWGSLRQKVLLEDRRKNWTRPSESQVHNATSLSQPSSGEEQRRRLGTQLRNTRAWALLRDDGHLPVPRCRCVTSPAGETSVSLET